jgi:hypothetical protein
MRLHGKRLLQRRTSTAVEKTVQEDPIAVIEVFELWNNA